jgi:hypothetical protein
MASRDTKQLAQIGEAVDRLISIDLSARGFISLLYDEARRANEDRPLCLTVAQRLLETAKPDHPIVIATGLPIRGWFSPAMAENDGPIGAATLARAVHRACHALPILICETEQTYVLEACVRAVGLTPTTLDQYDAAQRSKWSVPGRDLPVAVVLGFPADPVLAKSAARHILERSPTGMISIERQGADDDGRYHYGRGEENIPGIMAKVDDLFAEALTRGVYTVGVGDGGNELGMGNIKDVIRGRLPFGDKIAPSVRVSTLVAASVSNFGCYGIEACLAALVGDCAVLHTPEQDAQLIDECVRVGAVDGATGLVEPYVDALPSIVSSSFVHLLHAVVRNGLSPPKVYKLDDA